jgi:carbamoyltransferase
MRYALRSIGADIKDIAMVVSNNHHYRVLPFEKRIPFYVSLNYVPADYNDPYNLLPDAPQYELSHHLAHAYSAMLTSPFPAGLILVMDGMGESYQSMMEDKLDPTGVNYMHDIKLIREQKNEKFVGQPTALYPGSGYREAETAYYFDKNGIVPVFKRWSRERSPSELYNSGFENHESLGAVYSRISSHILGDWNACGKIMGLAPWANKQRFDAKPWLFPKYQLSEVELSDNFYHREKIMSGNPYDGSFAIDWEKLENLPQPNKWSEKRFGYLSNLAASVQDDLESSASLLVNSLRQAIDTNNLILTGGVALNSVMNAKIANAYYENGNGFENVYIPPAPGDEGIALGCAYYGYQVSSLPHM